MLLRQIVKEQKHPVAKLGRKMASLASKSGANPTTKLPQCQTIGYEIEPTIFLVSDVLFVLISNHD
jgi:hypothetical protein